MTGRAFGPCLMCGGVDIGVDYHDGVPHCPHCRRDSIDAPSCRYSNCGQAKSYTPHLAVFCRRCRHHWIERPGATHPSKEETVVEP